MDVEKSQIISFASAVGACANCWLARVCLQATPNLRTLRSTAAVLKHPAPIHSGQHLVRVGDPFSDLYAVRSGSFKAYTSDAAGREHILCFFMPGELIGLDSIQADRYRANVVAMQTSSICVIPYDGLNGLFAEVPDLAGYMLRIMSKNLANTLTLAGNFTADERVAAFLTGVAQRFGELGYSTKVFTLPMTRRDTAKYLRLAPETLTRVLTRFAKHDLLKVNGREITLVDRGRLDDIASCMGPLDI